MRVAVGDTVADGRAFDKLTGRVPRAILFDTEQAPGGAVATETKENRRRVGQREQCEAKRKLPNRHLHPTYRLAPGAVTDVHPQAPTLVPEASAKSTLRAT